MRRSSTSAASVRPVLDSGFAEVPTLPDSDLAEGVFAASSGKSASSSTSGSFSEGGAGEPGGGFGPPASLVSPTPGPMGDDPTDEIAQAFTPHVETFAGPLPDAEPGLYEPVNFFRIEPQGDAADAAEFALGWVELVLPGPCVLVPTGMVTRYPLLWSPNQPAKSRAEAGRSRGQGIVHIPAAGRWWVKLDTWYSGDTLGAVEYSILDSRSPWAGSRALQELQGSAVIVEGAIATTVPLGTSAIIMPDDPYRTAACLSILSTVAASYATVGFDRPPTAITGIFVPTLVSATAQLVQPLWIADSFLVKRTIRVFAAVADCYVTPVQWID